MWVPQPQDQCWPPVPPLGALKHIKLGRNNKSDLLPTGLDPAGALQAARQLEHPFAQAPPLDPTLQRTFRIAAMPAAQVKKARSVQLAMWSRIADQCEGIRAEWLSSLPDHVASMFAISGFHGPLFQQIHDYMVFHGYPDVRLYQDICSGMPTGGEIPRSGLWTQVQRQDGQSEHRTVAAAVAVASR